MGANYVLQRVKFTAVLRIDCREQRQKQGDSQQVLPVVQPRVTMAWGWVVAMDEVI